jgi:hypothetical protein
MEDTKKQDEIVTTEEISAEGLEPTPDYYYNLGNMVSPSRLRDMDVKVRIPFMAEFVSHRLQAGINKVLFKEHYQNLPLVTGVVRLPPGSTFQGSPLPDGSLILVPALSGPAYTRTGIDFGTLPIGSALIGRTFYLRVYNLDLIS